LEAVLWWLNYKLEEREPLIDRVLALVNWKKIQKNQLRFVKTCKIVKKCEKLQKKIKSLYK